MLYTPPRSTLHHTVLSTHNFPIGCVLMHVVMSLSTALPATYLYSSLEVAPCVVVWVATLFFDKSSVNKKTQQSTVCFKSSEWMFNFEVRHLFTWLKLWSLTKCWFYVYSWKHKVKCNAPQFYWFQYWYIWMYTWRKKFY